MAKKRTLAQRIAADPALKRKYLANPGLRSKLPDSALTPELRAKRRQNKTNARPVTQGSSLTTGELARESRNASALRYGPSERALALEQSRTRQAGVDMGGFYDAYQRELAQHQANTAQINAQGQQQLAAVAGSMRALDQGELAGQQSEAQAAAAQRGGTAANQAPDASNASLVRQQALAGMIAQQANAGTATSRYADTLATVVAPTQKLRAQAQSQQQMRDLADKLLGLATDKGTYEQDYRATRTADEAKNVLAQQALNLDVQKAQTDVDYKNATLSDKKRARATSNRNTDLSREQTATTAAARLRAQRAKAAGGGAAGRARNDKFRSSITTGAADARDLLDTPQAIPGPDGKPTDKKRLPTQAEVRRELRKRYKDADTANAAMDLAINGYISPENVRRLKARGITVPASLTRKPRRQRVSRKQQVPGGFLGGATAGAQG